jgi:hypothetical protein
MQAIGHGLRFDDRLRDDKWPRKGLSPLLSLSSASVLACDLSPAYL